MTNDEIHAIMLRPRAFLKRYTDKTSLINFIGKIMKMKFLRGMVKFRRYANTEKGEKRIVATLTTISVLGLVVLSFLIIGGILG